MVVSHHVGAILAVLVVSTSQPDTHTDQTDKRRLLPKLLVTTGITWTVCLNWYSIHIVVTQNMDSLPSMLYSLLHAYT